MKKFSLKEATSFQKITPISIWDENKKPFYINVREGKYKFNLPKGNYYLTFGELQPLKEFSPIREFTLPKKERNLKIPKSGLKFFVEKTPFVAHIYKNSGRVYLDPSLKNLPKYSRAFIILHEIGHYLYANEFKADLFAAHRMLKKGYNPSQIYKGFDALIKDRETPLNINRLKLLYHYLKTDES